METVFIIKTDANSDNFKKEIGEFFTTYCKEKNSNISIYELSETGKEQVENIIYTK
ncbi:hypothetical protein [Cytobacillus sp.]|uniref:hypothetical protein n=1 Tax=Cytobacillus sp. TaxID=2675269 RepID=UPI0028BEEB0C|nr:hypothetical protein [Cytobacillus sp.]